MHISNISNVSVCNNILCLFLPNPKLLQYFSVVLCLVVCWWFFGCFGFFFGRGGQYFFVCFFVFIKAKVSITFLGGNYVFVFQSYHFNLNTFCLSSINQVTVDLFTLLTVLGNCAFILQVVKNISVWKICLIVLIKHFVFLLPPPFLFFPFSTYVGMIHLHQTSQYGEFLHLFESSCIEDRISGLYSWLCCCLFSTSGTWQTTSLSLYDFVKLYVGILTNLRSFL